MPAHRGPGTATGTSYGIRLDAATAERLGAPARGALHPSFAYEIAFQLAAFAALWFWLRHLDLGPGATFVFYVAAYGVFRFLVEFVRGNEVVWHGLTRPQLVLAMTVPLVLVRVVVLLQRAGPAASHPPRRARHPSRPPSRRRPPHGAGMPLRGDRVHRYVIAFCPTATRSSRTAR